VQALFDAVGTRPVLALRRGLAEARRERARAALLGALALVTFVVGVYVAASDRLAGHGVVSVVATTALTLVLSLVLGWGSLHVLEHALTDLDRAYRRAEDDLERALDTQERTARALRRILDEGAA
jgi:small-conductance mechanosensitive channel